MKKLIQIAYIGSFAALLLAGCKKDKTPDPEPDPKPPAGTAEPILLTCDYFQKNPNAVLKDNPDAPVDYIVPENCFMQIRDDITVEPGVTIAFETNAGWNVYESGSLKIVGTTDKKITLTGTDKTPGAWRGVIYYSNDNKNEIAHTTIEYGGGKAFNSNGDLGNVIVYSGGKVKFHDNLVQHSKATGLNVAYDGGTAENISNNTFANNKSPLALSIRTIEELSANNTYTDNEANMVVVFPGDMSENITVKKISVPYHFSKHTRQHTSYLYRAQFTINPGVEIVMAAGIALKGTGDGASFNAVGTASEPIKFSGLVQQPGYWGHIRIYNSNPLNRIEHADIRHNNNNAEGAVVDWAASLYVGNTHFEDIKNCAIWSLWGNDLTVSGNTYINCEGDVCYDD